MCLRWSKPLIRFNRFLYVACVLLVVLILLPFIFTNPLFPVLTPKIPCIFPVKVTYKKSAKKNAKTYTKNLTSKITVKNPTIKVTSDSEIAIGTTTQVKATVKPSTAKVTYTTSDEKIATVDATSGVVTGVATGDVTITATAKNGKKTVKTDRKISVKKAILKSAVQKEYNKVDVVILGDTKGMKASDFKITNNATHATVVVKAVKAKKNVADTFTLETYSGMTDAKEYTLEFAGASTTFSVTDGTVAEVGISTQEIAAGTATEVKMTTVDKNNVVLSYEKLDNSDSSKGKTTAEVKLTKGYQDGTKLYLPAVGDTAEVKVTYHTGTFGTDGKEAGNLEHTFTVKAIDPSLIDLTYAVSIGSAAPAWTAESFKANTNVKLSYASEGARSAYFYIKNTDTNVEIDPSNYSDYSVESADKSKLLVTETNLTNHSTAVAVKGVAEGSTYIIIKKADKVVASLPVSVVAKSVATSLDLDKTSVTIAQGANVAEAVKLTLKDQYSDKMDIDSIDVTLLGKPSKSTAFGTTKPGESVKTYFTRTSNTASISGLTFGVAETDPSLTTDAAKQANIDKRGTYTFKVSAKNNLSNKTLDRTFVINVVKNTNSVKAYSLKFDQTDVDTTVGTSTLTAADLADKEVTIDVAKMENGGAIGLYTPGRSDSNVEYTVKNAKGDVLVKVGQDVATGDVKTNGAVTANIVGNQLVIRPITTTTGAISGMNYYDKNLEAGTYTVTAKFTLNKNTAKEEAVTCVGSFTIADTQKKSLSYEIPNYDFSIGGVAQTVKAAFKNTNLVKVYYDGELQNIQDVSDIKGTALANGGAYVKTVKVYVNVSGSNNMVPVTITVDHVINNCLPTDISE